MAESTVIRVDRNREGAFHSLSEAIGAAEGYWGLPVTLVIAPGIYRERIHITQPQVTLEGEGSGEVIITYDHGAYEILADGVKRGTFRTATAFIEGTGFTARNITFKNAAGPGETAGQALAVYVDAERTRFEECRLLGHQDTLFLAPLPPTEKEKGGFTGPGENRPRRMGTHLFRNCFIAGDVDFIFGGARALFEGCEIFSRDGGKEINGYVAAPCTPQGEAWGFVFRRCRFTSDCPPGTVYLGRPWREYGKTWFVACELGAHIHREGFQDWGKPQGLFDFAEGGNSGEGADRTGRASFSRELTEEEITRIRGEEFSRI